MMYPAYGGYTPDTLPVSYQQDVFLDDLSNPVAGVQAGRRLSKGSGSQQRALTGMRISKPSSANNSPRSTTMSNRRRTMISGDGWSAHRQQQVLDYLCIPQDIDVNSAPARKQSTRPVSWHPSSYHLQLPQQPSLQQQPQQQHYQQQQQQPGFPFPTPGLYAAEANDFCGGQAQFSPMMTSYSNDTSPSSTFSPLPLFPAAENAQFSQPQEWDASQRASHMFPGTDSRATNEEPLIVLNGALNTRTSNTQGLDWNTFIMQGFNNTTPPTPEAFSQAQQQSALSDVAVPYEPLDDPDEEGEILVGMGLYDTPDKFNEDPQLNNYRSTVSSLLGASYRPHEPQGKGLKLEETWEPPKADEEEDEDEDDDEEEEDEEAEEDAE